MTTDPTARAQSTPALDAVLNEAERVAREESGRCTGDPCEGCAAGRRVSRARAELNALRTPTPAPVEAYRYAQSMAVTERARGRQDEERAGLDLLHLLDRVEATPTPAPVTVPEGGWRPGDWVVVDVGLVWQMSEGGDFLGRSGGVLLPSVVRQAIDSGRVVYVHAPREDAPRPEVVAAASCGCRHPLVAGRDHDDSPEPAAAQEHHVPGAENFNALLDDVLANPEAREAFEKAQAEPVVAPLPTEAVEVAAVEFRRHVWDESERNWHVNLRCVCGADPGLSAEAAGHWMLRHRLAAAFAAADQRARDEGAVREVVEDLLRMHDLGEIGAHDVVRNLRDGSR